ncbi:MAG: hypothetical protein ACFCU1_07715 [Sumerlaeia bacterium]
MFRSVTFIGIKDNNGEELKIAQSINLDAPEILVLIEFVQRFIEGFHRLFAA